jgi:hypothetical protein
MERGDARPAAAARRLASTVQHHIAEVVADDARLLVQEDAPEPVEVG